MKKLATNLMIILTSFSLVACSSMNREQQGAVGGAVAGGVVGGVAGGSVLAAGVGAVAGALIGGVIGRSMDDRDRMQATNALNYNRPTHWVNGRTGRSFTVVPGRHVVVNGNPNCRKFYTKEWDHGHKQVMHGVACQMQDGSWRSM